MPNYTDTKDNFKSTLSLVDQESYDYPINLESVTIKVTTKSGDEVKETAINPLQSYFLKGRAGRGKTAVAVHIAKEWLRRFETYQNQKYEAFNNSEGAYTYEWSDDKYLGKVNFVPMNQLISCINDGFGMKSSDEAKAIYQRWCEMPLLIIDDLGKEKLSDFRVEKVFNLLNARYENRLQTVITTNFNLSTLTELGYSEALVSRILSLCGPDNVLEVYSSVDYRMTSKSIETNFANC